MAVGITTQEIKDGDGDARNVLALTSDGTAAGNTTFMHAVVNAAQALINPATKESVDAIAAALATTLMVNAGAQAMVLVTPTVTNGATAANKPLGGKLTFANVVNGTPKSGVLQSVTVTSKSVQTAGLMLYLFRDDPATGGTTLTDNTTAALAAGDVDKCIGAYAMGPAYSGMGTHTVWSLDNIGKAMTLAGTSLYAVLVPTAGMTLGSTSDITVRVNVLKDN